MQFTLCISQNISNTVQCVFISANGDICNSVEQRWIDYLGSSQGLKNLLNKLNMHAFKRHDMALQNYKINEISFFASISLKKNKTPWCCA